MIVLESLAGEGKWKAVAETLEKWKDAQGDVFDYYRAVVKGDHKTAMEILKKGGSSAGATEALLYEAQELSHAGKRKEAVAIWRGIAARTNVSERALVLASANAMDRELLERAYTNVSSVAGRRTVGLRLGILRVRSPETAEAGERLIRAIVKDSPDASGAREAFRAIAEAHLAGQRWKEAVETYHEAAEIWPDLSKSSSVQENRALALQNLGRRDEALAALRSAVTLATDDETKASLLTKEGDLLSVMGRAEESLARYRDVLTRYPKTMVAEKIKVIVRLREAEAEGRRLYAEGRYLQAQELFKKVAEEDSARRQRMSYFELLCLYGRGEDEKAEAKARELINRCPDKSVRAEAVLWLAKVLYNRRDWAESLRLFVTYAEAVGTDESATDALLWASRAALAENDFNRAIQLSTRLLDLFPNAACKTEALLVQGEALVELARFDEAILVFERVAIAEGVRAELRLRAQILRADAFFVMGADNPVRYEAALEAFRSVLDDSGLSASRKLLVAFKIARALEKLKRIDEAMDVYYAQVVLFYRNGRMRGEWFDDEARAAFSRAAFQLADEYEIRGKDTQALNVLRLVAASDVPAAEEARKRSRRLLGKGVFR